jgi:hypothetical protein
MRNWMWILLGLFFVCTPARGDDWTGNASLMLGGLSLKNSSWWPAEKQNVAGIQFDVGQADWPLNLAVNVLGGSGEGVIFAPGGQTTVVSRTGELDLGARGIWAPTKRLRPYLGGGVAFVNATMELDTAAGRSTYSDGGVGIWLDCGVYVTLRDAFNVGLDFRISGANIHLDGQDTSTNNGALSLIAGYHF